MAFLQRAHLGGFIVEALDVVLSGARSRRPLLMRTWTTIGPSHSAAWAKACSITSMS